MGEGGTRGREMDRRCEGAKWTEGSVHFGCKRFGLRWLSSLMTVRFGPKQFSPEGTSVLLEGFDS